MWLESRSPAKREHPTRPAGRRRGGRTRRVDWPSRRRGDGTGGGGGRHVIESSRERYNRPPLGAERQRLDVNQNPFYHTQAGHCWLFTGLHLGALYHSIRTAFTPHTTERRPSIKLKTSHWPWRGRREGTRSCHPTFIFPTCCCHSASAERGGRDGRMDGWRDVKEGK